jgi:predicted P-loop ATPase
MPEWGSEKQARCDKLRTLPQAMREKRQWLLWRFIADPKVPKPRKVPHYVSGRKRRGAQGSVEDRQELSTFDVALTEFARGQWDGLGFAFLPGDGLIGIDMDGQVDEETGEISERCKAIVAACGSYTEWSPSRKGVHIIVAGETKTFKDNSIGLEVFCNAQFFTCTGEHWEATPFEVAPIDERTLSRLKATVAQAREKGKGTGDAQPVQAPAPAKAAKADDYGRVNDVAMQQLDVWVPALFPAAKKQSGTGAWRISSKDLNRSLEEDLSIAPGGIVDFGIREADAREGRRTPIDLVVEYQGVKPRDALMWLAGRLGVALTPRPQKAKPKDDAPPASGADTPSPGSAGEGEGGEPPPRGRRDWREDLLRQNGGKKDCRENVYMVLINHPKLAGLVGYDEFGHRVMKLRKPPWDSDVGEWTTNDDYLLGYWLSMQERLVIKAEGTIVAGVAMAAYANRFHPVHEYLHGLPEWDGTERLAHWLSDCLGAEDSEYTRLVGAWFLMGMVKRILTPGCQMDYMVVLEGLQGKQKSTALRTLVGNDDWFADTPIRIGDKDAVLSLAGKWLYEVGELDAFNRAEVTAVKQYVSSRIDRVREPFARRPSDRPRSGVFAGSTNQSEYFKDPTGARRFWPVACDGEIQLELLANVRDQLFAEAMHRLASDDLEVRRYWPTREETDKYLVPQQERREIVDPWYERLAIWLDLREVYGDSGEQICDVEHFTSHELLTKALHVPTDRIDGSRQMATRVGIAMHKLGWEKRRDATGARLHRYWRPGKKRPAMEAQAAPHEVRPDGVPEELYGA